LESSDGREVGSKEDRFVRSFKLFLSDLREVKGFNAEPYREEKKSGGWNRFTQYAMAAAKNGGRRRRLDFSKENLDAWCHSRKRDRRLQTM